MLKDFKNTHVGFIQYLIYKVCYDYHYLFCFNMFIRMTMEMNKYHQHQQRKDIFRGQLVLLPHTIHHYPRIYT